MECREVEELLVAYVKGELGPGEAAAVEEHLAACASCRWNANAARETLDILEQARAPEVGELIGRILREAVNSAASDIHLQPERAEVRVRLRVDGVLHDAMTIPRAGYPALVARLHTMGDTDPFETRLPQFSRLTVRLGETDHDLHVQVMPCCWGQRVTIRVLVAGARKLALESVELSPGNVETVRRLMHSPCGLILFCGPAGSGKTTTMYACLDEANHREVSVATVEDPVQMLIEGVTQTHLNRRAGLNYPAALWALMRSDPDVVMVGEIGDAATAGAAMEMARTGHLVLAGFYAYDAVSAVQRLLAMGAEPFMLGETLIGVTWQRLARRVCPNCRVEYAPGEEDLRFLERCGLTPPERLSRGAGCDHCRGTGYRGRMAIHEVLIADDAVGNEIAAGDLSAATAAAALTCTMACDGAAKALAGVTDLAEVRRVTQRSYPGRPGP